MTKIHRVEEALECVALVSRRGPSVVVLFVDVFSHGGQLDVGCAFVDGTWASPQMETKRQHYCRELLKNLKDGLSFRLDGSSLEAW